MKKLKIVRVRGVVVEVLPDNKYKVEIAGGNQVIAKISGSIKRHYTKFNPGEKVEVELSPYDLKKGRIRT